MTTVLDLVVYVGQIASFGVFAYGFTLALKVDAFTILTARNEQHSNSAARFRLATA